MNQILPSSLKSLLHENLLIDYNFTFLSSLALITYYDAGSFIDMCSSEGRQCRFLFERR